MQTAQPQEKKQTLSLILPESSPILPENKHKLSLKLPEIKPIEFIWPGHKYMVYWKDTNTKQFCKTTRNTSGIKIPEHFEDSLRNEAMIMRHLSPRPLSPAINLPKKYYVHNGSTVIEQDFFNGGDLFTHISKGKYGINSTISLLRCVKLTLPYFKANNIIFNDWCLENIMIDPYGEMKVVDFGCALLFNEEKNYVWDWKRISTIRSNNLSPDIILNYCETVSMSKKDIFYLYEKKDMFTIGLMLITTLFGYEIWGPFEKHDPKIKIKDIEKLHITINKKLENKVYCKSVSLVLSLILKLLPLKLTDVISIEEFVEYVDSIQQVEYGHVSKRRRI